MYRLLSTKMKYQFNESEKVIYFRGKYPDVMGISSFMKKFPDYEPVILSWDDYNERFNVKDT